MKVGIRPPLKNIVTTSSIRIARCPHDRLRDSPYAQRTVTVTEMIVPSAVSVFNILVMRGFFANTSKDLIDAAAIDGASEWRTLRSIVLPTSRAVVAVISMFYAVGYWNTFFNALLYLPDNQKWPLQLVIYTYTLRGDAMPGTGVTQTGQYFGTQQIAPLSIQMAVVTLTLIPILVIYPFVQRHFAKGMLLGAVKG